MSLAEPSGSRDRMKADEVGNDWEEHLLKDVRSLGLSSIFADVVGVLDLVDVAGEVDFKVSSEVSQ
jgi:hypothetical protein